MHEAQSSIGDQPVVFQLIGHKSDLNDRREVLYEEGEYFAKYHKIKFVETSARNGENVEEAFHMLARDIFSRLETGEFQLMDDWDGIKSGMIRRPSMISLTSEIDRDNRCYC